VLDKAEYSAFQSTLNSRIVSYRIVSSLVGVRGSELSDDIYSARSRQLANADQYCMEITGFEDTTKHPLMYVCRL